MNRDYTELVEKYKDRNNLIIRLSLEHKTFDEIKKELEELGYASISRNRVWGIWKNSEYYKPRKVKTMFCNFCLENKHTPDLFQIKKMSKYKIQYRICEDCINKLLPEQPINE